MESYWMGGMTEEFMKAGGFSDAVSTPTGRMVFVSGQVGQDSEGKVGETLRDQAFIALENIKLILEKAGAEMKHVTQVMIFLSEDVLDQGREWWGIIGEANRHYFGDHKPCGTGVWIRRLAAKKYLVEIQVTAVVPE